MEETALKKESGRNAYFDMVRIAATLCVITIHLCSNGWYNAPLADGKWLIYNLFESISRWGVPTFLLLSGGFFIARRHKVEALPLFRRNVLRMVISLFFWGAFYTLLESLLAGEGFTPAVLLKAVTCVFTFKVHRHLWFLYMIIIAYAITPVVRRIIKNVSDKNVLIFGSALALASGVVPIITALFGVDTQYYMQTTGFLGVYLIGGALTEYKLSKTGRRLLYTAGILGVIATFVFTAIWSFNSGRAQTVLFNHVSPNNVLTAAAVYVFAISGGGKAQIKSEKVANGCHSLAQVCFSVYLIHEVFVIFIEAGALSVASTRHTAVAIVLYSLTVFICSACVAMLIKQIPVVKKYIS